MSENESLLSETVETEEKVVDPALEEGKVASPEKEVSTEETKDEKTDPIEYAFEFEEGFTVDEGLIEKFKPLAQEAGLSQESAQKLVNFYTEAQKAQLETWEATVKEWQTASKSDKEFGGRAFDENIAVARKALKEFGSDELTEVLDVYGMGNHPAVIRFLFRVGKTLAEDKVLVGGNPNGEKRDPARVLFPDMQ